MFGRSLKSLHRILVPPLEEPMEVRLFQQLSLASAFLTLAVVLPLNIFEGYSDWVNFTVGMFGLLCGWLWLNSLRGRIYPITLIVVYAICLNVTWITNGGSYGSSGLFFFPLALMMVIFLHGWVRTLGVGLYVLDTLALILLELKRPAWVAPFDNPIQRLTDVTAGFFVSSAACCLCLWIVIDDFRRERRTLRRAMAQLEQSTEEQLRTEAEKRQLATQLEHLQRVESLGRLAGGMAHDMNNILAAIMAAGETIQLRPQDAPEISKAVARILQASRRGRTLVSGLLDFARKGLGERVPLDLNALIRQEAELLASTTLRKIDLELDLGDPLPAILGDPNALANVLMNLCVNAADAMPHGGKLTLRTRQEGDQVKVAVCDSGTGMEPQVLARATEPFFSTKPQERGNGLGLSIVLGIIEAHEGTLDLQSVPGQGTCASFALPHLNAPYQKPPEDDAKPVDLAPQRVLLVDDDDVVRETAAGLLSSLGHQVIPCSGGRNALKRLQEGLAVDLVVLDMNMPGMSGEEVLRRLRESRPSLPVLIATGFTDVDVRTLLAQDAALGLIAKPYSMEELQTAMARIKPPPAAPEPPPSPQV